MTFEGKHYISLIISTHAPAGGATARLRKSAVGLVYFYSRPCGRGDLLLEQSVPKTRISTHAPAGGATISLDGEASGLSSISTHAPAGGATFALLIRCVPLGAISTHAPAGGATEITRLLYSLEIISTHAPAGGATWLSDLGSAAFKISTHAPAGGATSDLCNRRRHLCISTHAPAGGATASFTWHWIWAIFLLTPLREGRRLCIRISHRHTPHFYSRPCGRGDRGEAALRRTPRQISTHAPAGGATTAFSAQAQGHAYFYSRPCGRGDSNFPQVRHEVLRQIAER